MNLAFETPFEWAYCVLTEEKPKNKVWLSINGSCASLHISQIPKKIKIPKRPKRPKHPILLNHRDMPKRSSGVKGRVALVHALAHIELNAIDLAWDIILRFGVVMSNEAFLLDWISVAQDEAQHFLLLEQRLSELGSSYGDLPAHDGLWEAAIKTSSDILDRLAIIPMMLEARGIDSTPRVIERLKGAGDLRTCEILNQIYEDEINHLSTGVHWYEYICNKRQIEPVSTWRALVQEHLKTKPKEPINVDARRRAHMKPEYWEKW
ncbi:MAG: ferritin-like domain-containing protein [Rhodospirillaceae bacterium]